MAFVNEYVSEEDAKKYELKKIWDSFQIFHKGAYNEPGFRFTWTIDRERNVFFTPVQMGREENSNQTTFLLWLDGVQLTVELARGEESKSNLKEGTGQVIWHLVNIHKPSNLTINQDEIIPLLKEALTTYGYRGVFKTLSSYTVAFAF